MMGLRNSVKVGVLAFALSSGAAFANLSDRDMEMVSVSYAELDISKPAGAEVLYDRLQRAAKEVCGLNVRPSSAFYAVNAADWKACYEVALSRAVAEIDAPLVKEQHAG